MTTIIDRRLNPPGKSIPNRKRFLDRAREQVKKAVRDAVTKRSIKDIDSDKGVDVTTDGTLDEPHFARGQGNRDHVLPGNEQYHKGDGIPRPPGSSGGKGRGGSPDGDGMDEFAFTLTKEEFLDIFFEEMALPNLERRELADMDVTKPQRAGYSTSGSPSAINVLRTMRRGMARRISLGRPDEEELERLKQALIQAIFDGEGIAAARLALEEAEARVRLVPFLDSMDVRYNRFDQKPTPRTAAVMFCLMDVSGSMTERHKDIAKRFFMLLYLFLGRQYKKVDVVFIRHTSKADEVDEHTFFYGKETGGTVVSTALQEMLRIQAERYSVAQWNVYVAQASDGDNHDRDDEIVYGLLTTQMRKVVNYYAYLEITSDIYDEYGYLGETGQTGLWKTFQKAIAETNGNWLVAKQAKSIKDVFPVLADLFAKNRGV